MTILRTVGAVSALVLLAACTPDAPPPPEVAQPAATVPPPEARPPGVAPSIKWLPESPRFQYARRQHYAASLDFRDRVDLRTRQASRRQLYRAEIIERSEPVELNEFQEWTVRVQQADGTPVAGAVLGISGSMPQHGHGMASQPQASAGAVAGEYRIKGLQFSMPGWWEVNLYISKDRVDDTVTFNLLLE